jgi:hypothetical protein
MTAVETIFFGDFAARLGANEKLEKLEDVKWRAICEEYKAARLVPGTPLYSHDTPAEPTSTIASSKPPKLVDENGIEIPDATSTVRSEFSANGPESTYARRMMDGWQRSKFVGSNFKVRIDEVKEAVSAGADRIKFTETKSRGREWELGGSKSEGSATAIRLRLATLPFLTDPEKLKMAMGVKRFNSNKISILDWAPATGPEDCDKISVIREGVAHYIEWTNLAYGPGTSKALAAGLNGVALDRDLEDKTRRCPLLIPVSIDRALAELSEVLRSPQRINGVIQDLSDLKWVPIFMDLLRESVRLDANSVSNFKDICERDARNQFKLRFASSKSSKRAADSDEESDKGAEAKKARTSSAAATMSVVPAGAGKKSKGAGVQQGRQPQGAQPVVKGLCFGALAEYVSFGGFKHCTVQPASDCRFNHDMACFTLPSVKKAINKSNLPCLAMRQARNDFIAQVELSGNF